MIQLREKDLGPLELGAIASAMLDRMAEEGLRPREQAATGAGVPRGPKLLVNNCLRAAVESRADGVHLPSNSVLLPEEVRRRYAAEGLARPTVTVSCHSMAEIQIARRNGADAILFAPVFGKVVDGVQVVEPVGLDGLREICEAAAPVAVLALGGITWENVDACVEAGAAGVAGIRLFHRQYTH